MEDLTKELSKGEGYVKSEVIAPGNYHWEKVVKFAVKAVLYNRYISARSNQASK